MIPPKDAEEGDPVTSLERAKKWLDANAYMVQPFDRGEDETAANKSLAALLDAHAAEARERALEEAAAAVQVVVAVFVNREAACERIRALKEKP